MYDKSIYREELEKKGYSIGVNKNLEYFNKGEPDYLEKVELLAYAQKESAIMIKLFKRLYELCYVVEK